MIIVTEIVNLVSWEVCCYPTLEFLKDHTLMFFLVPAVPPALAAKAVKKSSLD